MAMGDDKRRQLDRLEQVLDAAGPVPIKQFPGDQTPVFALVGAGLLTENDGAVSPTAAARHYEELTALSVESPERSSTTENRP